MRKSSVAISRCPQFYNQTVEFGLREILNLTFIAKFDERRMNARSA
jgi:hypothetical protein